jgi:outer membrane protein assembly factor BamB
MSFHSAMRLLAVAMCGLAAVLPRPGEAGVPATLNTAIAASAVTPASPTIPIAADKQKMPTGQAGLDFPLAPLPKAVTLENMKVCAVRLVMAEATPGGTDSEGNGVLLELVDRGPLPKDWKPERTVAAINVPPGTPANTAIILRSTDLCKTLRPGGENPTPDRAQFRLRTTIRQGNVMIYGAPSVTSNAPRLMLTYTLPDALPGDAGWSQLRHDAQHSGRSGWRMYDPDDKYTPTGFTDVPLNVSLTENWNRGDLSQSPLLYGGKIFSVLDAGPSEYRLVAMDRSGRILGEAKLKSEAKLHEKPMFLAAGGRGRLYYAAENRILGYGIGGGALFGSPDELPIPPGETVLTVPTVGADGSLYVVTQKFVRAFSPYPEPKELWRYPTGQDNVGAVTLSADESTAYVLFGATAPRLEALDSATGDCRWGQQIKAIERGPNERMPIPVVAGRDILVTRAYPTSDELYVFHDASRSNPPDQGELVPPATSCRAQIAPNGQEERGKTGDHIAAPVAGPAGEALYIRGGKFCWSREKETCDLDLDGCSKDEATKISLLIGDNNAGKSVTHLYGFAAAEKELFFISWGKTDAGAFYTKCRMAKLDKLGPNLILGPDGTLYNSSEQRQLLAIVPNAFPPTAADLPLTAELLDNNTDSAFRVPGKITADNLTLGADTDLIIVAGQSISFGAGFKVEQGAQLRARVGLGQ